MAVIQMAPMYAWANKYFKHFEPEIYDLILANNRSDLNVCGGVFDTHAVLFDSADIHSDPEKFAALLSYFKGAEGAPWTGGGDIVLPEARLAVVNNPGTEVIIVCTHSQQ